MLLSSVFLVLTMYVLIQWTVDKELIKYINIREQQLFSVVTKQLGERYGAYSDWSFIERQPHRLNQILRQADQTQEVRNFPKPHFRPPPPRGSRGQRGNIFSQENVFRPPPPPKKEQDFAILDINKQLVVGRYRPDGSYTLTAIETNDVVVGWLALKNKRNPSDDFDLALQDALSEGFLLISILVIVLSSALAIPLTHFIVRRIKALTKGTKAISNGDLKHRVEVDSNDELGDLGRDFNQLAQTLEQNESARKRWIADISHELRTPLAITSGELEAMEDGVRPLNLENIKSARDEIKHLQRLVDDLYELTNADIGAISYHKSQFDLAGLVQGEGEHFALIASEKGLALSVNILNKKVIVTAEASRLKQLIQNLLGNSIKYTNAPGEICIALKVYKKPESVLS